MARSEEHHNTPEQVLEYLRAALEVVAELEPPDDLRSAVFTAAVNLISGKQIVVTQPAPLQLGGALLPGPRH